jgi:AAA family ATP:ADP antiporter
MTAETDNTRRGVWTAVVVGMLVVGQVVAARAIRDGFFLSHYAASELPKMIVVSATLSVIFVLGSTHFLRRVAPAKSVPWMFSVSAMLFAFEWLLALYQPGITAVVLYIHVMSLVTLVASGFWSVVSERFDPYTAKLSIGRIGGGATLGGVIGGATAWWSATRVEVASMLLALALLNICCAVGVRILGAGSRPVVAPEASQESGVSILKQTPYLRDLAMLVAMGAFCQACYDIVFKSRVADHYAQGSELVSFFALFYMGLSICTFLVQNLLTRRFLHGFGLSVTVGTLPGSGLLLGAVALIFPGLGSAVALRGGVGVIENSSFRSGYELLYTPVLPHKKRPTKTIIDVAGEMSGAILGGSCAFLIFALLPDVANPVLVLAGMAASLGGIYITRRIRLGYINSLAGSLQAGQIDLEEAAFGSMQRALTGSTSSAQDKSSTATSSGIEAGLSRDALKQYLHLRRPATTVDSPTDEPTAWRYAPLSPEELPAPALETMDELTRSMVLLRGGNEQQIRRLLKEKTPLPAELFSVVLPLLQTPAVADEAALALRRVGPAHIGALLDALRSQQNSRPLRRKICELLGDIPIQRCADGLLEFLDTDDLELRLRGATSLLHILRTNSKLQIQRRRVYELISLQANISSRLWSSQVTLSSQINATPPVETAIGRQVIQGFTYISTLLLTVLEQQPTILALRALAHTSDAHRGTGIEYLDNVLPARLLATLRPLLVDNRLALGKVSARSEILAELSQDPLSEADELRELRAHIEKLRAQDSEADSL